MDTQALKGSWHLVAQSGDQVPLFFYSALFLMFPETRALFPVSMATQRDRLVNALGHVVSNVDRVDDLVPFLQQLGRDHRKFSVVAQHYPAVGQALLATLEHFLGDRWTPALARDWTAAYGLVAKVMTEAAEESSATTPPWWEGEIILHEQRAPGVAVIRVRLNYAYPFRAGQSASISVGLRPKLWRFYSFANAPRRDNTLDFHVRVVDGGTVSTALVHGAQRGDVLKVGAPVGDRLTLDPGGPPRDLVMVAGGTGLAPLKAVVEQVAYEGPRCDVRLYVGARTARELYDLEALSKLDAENPWLSVVPVVSNDAFYSGEHGYAVDAALKGWRGQDVYVCGSEEMVQSSVTRLLDAGVPPAQIRFDEFTSAGGRES